MAKKTETNEQPRVGRPPKRVSVTDAIIKYKEAIAALQQCVKQGDLNAGRAQLCIRHTMKNIKSLEKVRIDESTGGRD